jgi:hypothetical protein
MIYSSCTFIDCYNVFFPLHAYFLPTLENGEVPVLGKLPYAPSFISKNTKIVGNLDGLHFDPPQQKP